MVKHWIAIWSNGAGCGITSAKINPVKTGGWWLLFISRGIGRVKSIFLGLSDRAQKKKIRLFKFIGCLTFAQIGVGLYQFEELCKIYFTAWRSFLWYFLGYIHWLNGVKEVGWSKNYPSDLTLFYFYWFIFIYLFYLFFFCKLFVKLKTLT